MKTLNALLSMIINAFKICDHDLADSIKEKDISSVILNLVLIALMFLGIALTIAALIYLAFKFWWVPFIGFIVVECLFALLNKIGSNSKSNSETDEVEKILIRPLAKLNKAIKIADACDQGKAKSKPFSTVAVALGKDTKSFDQTDSVFNKNTFS